MKRNYNILQPYNAGSTATHGSPPAGTYNGASRNAPFVQRGDMVKSGIATPESADKWTSGTGKTMYPSSQFISTALLSCHTHTWKAGARLNQKGGPMNR